MSDRETTRNGEALPDSGADGSGVVASSDDRPLEWVYESPVHGVVEVSYYELKRYLEDNRWIVTVHTVVWLTDLEPLSIESEVRDPKLVEALLTAYALGRKAGRRAALEGGDDER